MMGDEQINVVRRGAGGTGGVMTRRCQSPDCAVLFRGIGELCPACLVRSSVSPAAVPAPRVPEFREFRTYGCFSAACQAKGGTTWTWCGGAEEAACPQCKATTSGYVGDLRIRPCQVCGTDFRPVLEKCYDVGLTLRRCRDCLDHGRLPPTFRCATCLDDYPARGLDGMCRIDCPKCESPSAWVRCPKCQNDFDAATSNVCCPKCGRNALELAATLLNPPAPARDHLVELREATLILSHVLKQATEQLARVTEALAQLEVAPEGDADAR